MVGGGRGKLKNTQSPYYSGKCLPVQNFAELSPQPFRRKYHGILHWRSGEATPINNNKR